MALLLLLSLLAALPLSVSQARRHPRACIQAAGWPQRYSAAPGRPERTAPAQDAFRARTHVGGRRR